MLSARPQLQPQEVLTLMQASARAFPSSGAGNGENGQPLPMCRPPDGIDQLQCYCSVGLCGAGMVDASGAVQAAGGTLARIALEPAVPVVGDTLRLDATASLPASGRGLAGYEWALVANPGVVAALAGAANTAQVELQAVAAGAVVVALTVVDDGGQRATVQRSIVVASAPPVVDEPVAGGGDGGGASSALWVGLLALAVAALLHERSLQTRRRGGVPPP